jgi:hypothetical protein
MKNNECEKFFASSDDRFQSILLKCTSRGAYHVMGEKVCEYVEQKVAARKNVLALIPKRRKQ